MKSIIRTTEDYAIIKEYKCKSRSSSANKRFNECITKEEVYDSLVKYNFMCFYCNDKIKKENWQLDHFYSRAMGGKNIFDNIVPCCKWCNTMKNALDGHSFVNKCNQICNNNFFVRNLDDYILIDKIKSQHKVGKLKKARKILADNYIEVNDAIERAINKANE